MDKEFDIREKLKTNVIEYLKSNNAAELKNERFVIKNFDEILLKRFDNLIFFNHPIYKEKDIHYFNEEEKTDFLFFEENCVYVDYNEELYNFHKIDQNEKLLYLDLNNQEIIDINSQKDEENLEEEINNKTDIIAVNYFPLSETHTILTVCSDQNFPQVLSTEFLSEAINIFSMSKNKSLRVGYNSLGGGALINHLHFEIIFIDEFNIESLPIENAKPTQLFKTDFRYKDKDEINLFEGVSVKISTLDYPLFAWKIEAFRNSNDEIVSIENAISQITDTILNILSSKECPHNLLISDFGKTVFIIPRKFHNSDLTFNTCWNDLCGLVTFKDKELFNQINPEQYSNLLKEKVSLESDGFIEINEIVLEKFNSLYEIEK